MVAMKKPTTHCDFAISAWQKSVRKAMKIVYAARADARALAGLGPTARDPTSPREREARETPMAQ